MPVGAIILAAGGSTRFGEPKQLTPFRGKSLVSRAVSAAVTAECEPIIVVVGEEGQKIESELATTPAIVVRHAKWREGVGSSIRVGVQAVHDRQVDAVVLLTCDQPFVDATTIKSLIDLGIKTGKSIVASAYSNTLGIPALFHRSHFGELRALEGESGAKSLIMSRANDVASFDFPAGAIDVDTKEDYQRLIRE